MLLLDFILQYFTYNKTHTKPSKILDQDGKMNRGADESLAVFKVFAKGKPVCKTQSILVNFRSDRSPIGCIEKSTTIYSWELGVA